MSDSFCKNIVYQKCTNQLSFSYPTECPRCGRHIHIDDRNCKYLPKEECSVADDLSAAPLQITIKCPACSQLFITDYNYMDWYNIWSKDLQKLIPPTDTYPKENIELDLKIPDCVRELSENFVEIYQQSYLAELYKLNGICGCCYRKALEFLIKDYCISKHKDKERNIKEMFLQKCINTYIDDPRIKGCAERAAWLGNDETHYIRRWGNKDLSDLKTLIRLTINWIENESLTQYYNGEFEEE